MTENDAKPSRRVSRLAVMGLACLVAFFTTAMVGIFAPYGSVIWNLLHGTPWGLTLISGLLLAGMALLALDLNKPHRR